MHHEDYSIGIIDIDYQEINRIAGILSRIGYFSTPKLAPEIATLPVVQHGRIISQLFAQINANKKSLKPENDIADHYVFKNRPKNDFSGRISIVAEEMDDGSYFLHLHMGAITEAEKSAHKGLLNNNPNNYQIETNDTAIHEYFLWHFLWSIKNPTEDDIAYVCLLVIKLIDAYAEKSGIQDYKQNDQWKKLHLLDKLEIYCNDTKIPYCFIDGDKGFYDEIKEISNAFLHGVIFDTLQFSHMKVNMLNGCIEFLYGIINSLVAYTRSTDKSLWFGRPSDTLASIMAFPKFAYFDEKIIYQKEWSRFNILQNVVLSDREHIEFGNTAINTYIQCFYGITLLENQLRIQHSRYTKKNFIDEFRIWLKEKGYNLATDVMWQRLQLIQKARNKKGSHINESVFVFLPEDIRQLGDVKQCISHFSNIMNEEIIKTQGIK